MSATAVTAILPDHNVEQEQTETRRTDAAPQYATDQSRANSFGIASFIIGLASIAAGWSIAVPVVGLVLGILALRRGTAERTLALWGVWLNGALLALSALAIAAVVAVVGFGLIALPFAG